jgi:hypothetical protein
MKPTGFKPWVGDKYKRGGLFHKRVLILGESHYNRDGPALTAGITRQCIRGQINGDGTMAQKFWTNITMTFLDHKPTTSEERHAFWHSVAYYNYVQVCVGFRPRVRPSPSMWRQSEPAFLEVLSTLRPQFILVLGCDLWNRLPPGLDGSAPVKRGAKWKKTRRYPIGDNTGTALAYGIKHPSAIGYNGRHEHPLVMKVLRLA